MLASVITLKSLIFSTRVVAVNAHIFWRRTCFALSSVEVSFSISSTIPDILDIYVTISDCSVETDAFVKSSVYTVKLSIIVPVLSNKLLVLLVVEPYRERSDGVSCMYMLD